LSPQPLRQQPPPATGGWEAQFTYDGLGRLRIRQDYYAYTNGFYLTNTTWYLYDRNRVIQERDATDTPTVSYTRGPDVSGTLEAAGGIGGLLARSGGYSSGNWTSHAYYHADGNGNITAMVDSSQTVVASYDYDPFGNLNSSSGTLAGANLYRFSSKEFHVNSGLYYYLYRFYDPSFQRWINRDPIGEPGFELLSAHQENPLSSAANLFSFVGNEPTISIDAFGLLTSKYRKCNPTEQAACAAQCIQTGVKSCTVTEIWGLGPDGKPKLLFYDPDCQCNPARKHIPWKQCVVGVGSAVIIVLLL
jgi:RHS repeat-associated protein